ncbi:MAG: YdcH family protein [Rhizobiaceae bacterium]
MKDQLLKALRNRRADVQTKIDDEQTRPAPDTLKLSVLKKIRLKFRDQIEFIERMNRQGELVAVPVVRRRSFRPVLQGRS